MNRVFFVMLETLLVKPSGHKYLVRYEEEEALDACAALYDLVENQELDFTTEDALKMTKLIKPLPGEKH